MDKQMNDLSLQRRLHRLIGERRFPEVFELLKQYRIVSSDQVERVEESYRLLIQYYLAGTDDTRRFEIYDEIGLQLWHLVGTAYSANASLQEVGDERLLSVEECCEKLKGYGETRSAAYFHAVESLFDSLLGSYPLSEEDQRRTLLLLTTMDELVARVVVGALFLSIVYIYDEAKMKLLITACQDQRLSVRMTALPGVLLLSTIHAPLLRMSPDLVKQGRAVLQEQAADEMYAALDALFTSYKTLEDHQVYLSKILPQLKDLARKFQLPSMMQGEELLDKLRAEEHVEELQDLERTIYGLQKQMKQDRDLGYHGVTDLKRAPFFSEMARWFMPFDKHHYLIREDNAEAFFKIVPMAFKDTTLCSSDIYSYVQVTDWSKMLEMIAQQAPIPSDLSVLEMQYDPAYCAKDFVFGAFRFFTLSRWQHYLISPFQEQPLVLRSPLFSSVEEFGEEVLKAIGLRLVGLREYEAAEVALSALERLTGAALSDGLVFRSLAFLSKHRGDRAKALDYLIKSSEAEGLQPKTVARIVELYQQEGSIGEAKRWLYRAIDLFPEEVGLLSLLGQVLVSAGEYDEATSVLYKAYYLSDGSDSTTNALLARVCLLQKQPGQGLERIRSGGAPEECLQGGLCALALGQKGVGVDLLGQWVAQVAHEGFSSIEVRLDQELQILRNYGYGDQELLLISNIIRASHANR